MVMIGTDSHKRTHAFVALDDVGRRLGERTLRVNTDGHLQLLTWAAHVEDVACVLEDCRSPSSTAPRVRSVRVPRSGGVGRWCGNVCPSGPYQVTGDSSA